MKKAQIEKDIKELEKALTIEGLSVEKKGILETALSEAKAKLASLPTASSATPSATAAAAAPMSKTDFYAAMDKTYGSLTYNALAAMPQGDYDDKLASLIATAEGLLDNKKLAKSYTTAYINNHLRKGEKAKKTTGTTAKKEPVPKPAAKTDAALEKATYSWKKATAKADLTPIVNHCQQYALEVKETTVVELLGDDKKKSYTVTANPGDYLIFNQSGYLVYVMLQKSFQKDCVYNTTIADHEAKLHRSDEVEKLETSNAQLKEEVAALKVEMEQKGKISEKKAEELDEQPNAAVDKPATKKKTPHECTAEDLDDAEVIARVMEFIEENSNKLFHNIWKSSTWKKAQEIIGVYEMRGKSNEGKLLLHVKEWNANAQNKDEWYSLCIDTYQLTSVEAPKRGSYEKIVSKNQLQAIYSTKGEEKHRQCARLHSDLARCRAKGNCTAEQKQRYGRQTAQCGNLAKRFIGTRKYAEFLHSETRKRRTENEPYVAAVRRTAQELRAELA